MDDPDHFFHDFPKVYLAVIFLCFICMWIFLASVKYIKFKMPNLKRQYQRNILTFYQNFFFYLCFFIISVSLTLVKLIVPHMTSPENTKFILICFYILRLLFVCFLRPVIIILILRKRMPHFYENYKKKNIVISIFYISGKTLCARNELFKPLKSFSQDARFGSEKKFNELNLKLENNIFIQVQRNKEKDVTNKSKLLKECKCNCIPEPDVHQLLFYISCMLSSLIHKLDQGSIRSSPRQGLSPHRSNNDYKLSRVVAQQSYSEYDQSFNLVLQLTCKLLSIDILDAD